MPAYCYKKEIGYMASINYNNYKLQLMIMRFIPTIWRRSNVHRYADVPGF